MMSRPPRHFLDIGELPLGELRNIIDAGRAMKAKLKAHEKGDKPLEGKTLAMIFERPSTRTRVSFDVGMRQLGGESIMLTGAEMQLGRGETIGDTARVLSRYVDVVMVRTTGEERVHELAAHASVPIINGLTDLHHPCQVLADIQTVYEHLGTLDGLKLAFVGDGHNMAHSLMEICSILGIDVFIACPEGYQPNADITAACQANGAKSGARVVVTTDPAEAARNADVIYTDVWTSMGQEAETAKRMKDFAGFVVDGPLMKLAQPKALFLHCLPAHRGEEVTADVIDGPNSVVFDEAENRLHAQKAVLAALMGGVQL